MDLIQLGQSLKSKQHEIQQILPKNIEVEKFIRIGISEFRNNPKLLACSGESVYAALLQCAELGLFPSKTTGLCHLIPYKGECQLQVDYKGLIHVAIRSGHVTKVRAVGVKSKDYFEVIQGTKPELNHIVNYDLDNEGFVAFYAVATLENNDQQFEVMTVKEIKEIQKRARSQNIWNDNFSEMAKKTVVRRLMKYLPSSPKLDLAMSIDNKQFK